MTAEVNILIEEDWTMPCNFPSKQWLSEMVSSFVPVPDDSGGIETREIRVGVANETDVVILSGLTINEDVVLNISDEGVSELLALPDEET